MFIQLRSAHEEARVGTRRKRAPFYPSESCLANFRRPSVRPSVPFLPPSASKHKFHVHPLPADYHPSLKLAAVAASRQSINIDILQRAKGTERGVQCLALTFGVSLCNSRNLHSLSLVCESIHDRPQLIAEAAAVAPLCATRQWMGMQNWAKGKTGERVRDG